MSIKQSTATIALSTVAIGAIGMLLIGCGSSSTDGTTTGYFIDSAVAGVHYTTSSGLQGDTDKLGRFQYNVGDDVELSLGKIVLGKTQPGTNGEVTPKTLIAGDGTPDANETASITLMLQFLQSLDSDGNTSNGITITQTVSTDLSTLKSDVHFDDLNETYLIDLDNKHDLGLDRDYDGHLDVNSSTAEDHFKESQKDFDEGKYGNSQETNYSNEDKDSKEFTLSDYPVTAHLTQDLNNSLAYMGNEERLAHDVYLNLYDYQEKNGIEIKQFYNIATRAESKHIAIVQSIVQRYNLNPTDLTDVNKTVINDNNLSATTMKSGVYDIQKIQDLYDSLYALGQNSQEDALKVGCMVEVTDIDDLDKYITQAKESNATDIEAGFNTLRDGSYNHYWAFDKALKNIGVSNGCYYAGDTLLTNKDGIYPQNENGENSQGKGKGNGNGNGKQKGRQ